MAVGRGYFSGVKYFLIPTEKKKKKVPKQFASDNNVWCNFEDEKLFAGLDPV